MTPSQQDDNEATDRPGWLTRRRHGLVRWAKSYPTRLSVMGAAGAVTAGLWSYTPSLIPRDWMVQGLVTGLSLITAYGLCNLIVWVLRGFDIRGLFDRPVLRRRIGWITASVAPVGWVVMVVLGLMWQREQRDMLGMEPLTSGGTAAWVLSILLAISFASVILAISRVIRTGAHRLGLLLRRVLPARMATVIAAVLVGVLTWGIASNVIGSGMRNALDSSFEVAAGLVDPGSTPPTVRERSGSSDSLVNWEDLGREGRRFVTRGPHRSEIVSFEQSRDSGSQLDEAVKEPIRAYAGLTSSIADAAQTVVAELDRTDAWDREALLVVTTTGSGWVDPAMVAAFELVHGGDTAVAAMQYSYLPSWMAFLADRGTPATAGQVLFEAVYAKWSQQPAQSRPKLYAAGISLGSYGMQAAFSGLQDLQTRTDGALFAGTPYFVPMWNHITDHRDPGSTQVSPVYQGGEKVRFYTGDSTELHGEWQAPRTVYIQHGSDGTSWWDPEMLLIKPDWMKETGAPDVMNQVNWFPVTSFWQVGFDLFFAAGDDIPMGVGHQFQLEYADGFVAIVQPEGWTSADTQLLREALTRGGHTL
ncbi:Uncharacterized membrane protein [Micrococcales bacterium KH10]|nr:Uncharacterized membrane protein [Micrococcales bacterium KH10]